jgi:hypothetical protein
MEKQVEKNDKRAGFAEDVLEESKIAAVAAYLRTVTAFFMRPTKLREAIVNKRWGRYTRPLAYFCFSLALVFLTKSLFGDTADEEPKSKWDEKFEEFLPLAIFVIGFLPSCYFTNLFMRNKERSFYDMANITCYTEGSLFLIVGIAAVFDTPNKTSSGEFVPLHWFVVICFLLVFVRHIQLGMSVYNRGFMAFTFIAFLGNVAGAIGTFLVLVVIGLIFGGLGSLFSS